MAEIGATKFIRENLRLLPVRSIPEIHLYSPHAGSGLGRLADRNRCDAPPPYWAYRWAGGLALARHILDHPASVAGRRVLDLGTGSGLVAIASALAGASAVLAADIDPDAICAAGLNAQANGVALAAIGGDLLGGPPPSVDIVTVGDLFYDGPTATRTAAFLDRCLAAGIDVLVGDPYRIHLPLARLRPIAHYAVPDFGQAEARAATRGGVFAYGPVDGQAPKAAR